MKMRYGFIAMLVVIMSVTSMGQLLTEDFSYSGQLNANGWGIHSGTTNFIATTTGLTYSGYPGSGVGNAAQVSNLGGEDVNLGFTQFDTDGQTVYAFFLVNINEAATTKAGDYFFNLGDRSAPTTFTLFCARVGVKITSDVVNFGISNTSTITYGATAFAKNTTYLLIVKYTISTAGNDPVSLWVKSSGVPADELSAGAAEVTNTTTLGTNVVDAVALRQGSATNSVGIVVDGLRITNVWDASSLPVELTSFKAIAKGKNVELTWNTATEVNNVGFEIEKSKTGEGRSEMWEKIGFVEGNGTTNAPKSYSFVDGSAKGTVSYRLKQIDRDGKFEYSNTVEAVAALTSEDYSLTSNYPNPFNPTTKFSFAVPTSQRAVVRVFNMLGQEVATLFNGIAEANMINTLEFNGKGLASGIYFYSLKTENRYEVKKMLMTK